MSVNGDQSRRLAAILAADMVGYSRLMELDEAGTLSRQKTILTELIFPRVDEYEGRLVKTTGDGALIEFPSAVNAVLCAAALQREISEQEAATPEDRRIAYRIGINLGDIIIDGDDIFGDGVNIASRLEGLAEPGGIRISEAVFNSVRGKLELGFVDLGPQKVKNLSEPVPTYQVLLDPADVGKLVKSKSSRLPLLRHAVLALITLVVITTVGFFARDRLLTPANKAEHKLLVLPLTAADANSTFVAQAATENLLASFARLKELTTAPRDVSMAYSGIALAMDEVPDKHNVRYVLDGTTKFYDGAIDFSMRLREVGRSDDIVWEATETGRADQLFEVLAMLKLGATGAMKVTLNQTEREILESRPAKNIEAYVAFTEAERLLHSGDFTKIENALPLFERALKLESDFVDAQLGYVDINFRIWRGSFNTIRYSLDALEAAETTIATVLTAHPQNARALAFQIAIQVHKLNREQALASARAGVFNQPDEPSLRFALGLSLLASGEYEGAKAEFAEYEALSPRLNSGEKRDLAWQYLMIGDPDKALSLLASVPANEAQTEQHYLRMSIAHALKEDIENAQFYMQKFLRDTVWVNLMWQKPWFEIYADRAVFKNYAAAVTAAGLPELPHNFGKDREDDRLQNEDLLDLFSTNYQEIHSVGPFAAPYQEIRRPDGTIVMKFAWMNGIDITGEWSINSDFFCHRLPAIHQGREECNKVYIDREKSNDDVKYLSNIYSFGIINSEFRRVAD